MQSRIQSFLREVESFTALTPEEAEQFRIRFLSKKGVVTELFEEFKKLPSEQKREAGALLNELKNRIQERIELFKSSLTERKAVLSDDLDLTRPADHFHTGARHPLSIIRNRITEIFSRIGYSVSEDREIEDDWHNFTALNFPQEHPARDMQDTFFISKDPDLALRTHTSSVQIRVMEKTQPPIRKIFPGRVFRNEAISARAHCIFHQVEGLYVDKDVSFADLKQTLLFFAKEMFGAETQIRLRPSYFPFTEPSGEMDVSCLICGGKGCNICKYTGWVEILGLSLIHI